MALEEVDGRGAVACADVRVSMYGVLKRYTRVSAFASWIDSVITLGEGSASSR